MVCCLSLQKLAENPIKSKPKSPGFRLRYETSRRESRVGQNIS